VFARSILAVVLSLWAINSSATLKIEITEGAAGAEQVAIVPFGWAGAAKPKEGIASIVSADLHRSGRFNPVAERDMLAKPTDPQQINFKNWRILEIPYLVIGQVQVEPNQNHTIVVRLYDVFRQTELFGKKFKAKNFQLRAVAHQISDAIYEELTGERGAFSTKLAYIKKLPKTAKTDYRYLLFTADADTHNERLVLRSKNPIISPAWSSNSKKLAFVVVRNLGSSIYIYDDEKNESERITQSREKFSAPAWSPDLSKLAVQANRDGGSDIYIIDLKSGKRQRVIEHWSIDAEPIWSPDGGSLIFTSERGGSAQLYQYYFDNKQIRRLTFEGRQNLRASFSPDGKMITFVHLSNDRKYYIAVMDMETLEMRMLTKPSHQETEHESPSFAPNGSMVIYAANYQNQRGVLAAVSVDGGVHQRFSNEMLGGEVHEPAWSSFLD